MGTIDIAIACILCFLVGMACGVALIYELVMDAFDDSKSTRLSFMEDEDLLEETK